MKISLELTEEELKALDAYSFKKLRNLEVSNLTETTCYGLFCKIHYVIVKALK